MYLIHITDDVESTISRLSKTSFGSSLTAVFEELRTVVRFATILGVKRRILFKPRLPNSLFTGGFVFEILKGSKRSDVIASGGRFVVFHLSSFQELGKGTVVIDDFMILRQI
jgi:hypothetical protein